MTASFDPMTATDRTTLTLTAAPDASINYFLPRTFIVTAIPARTLGWHDSPFRFPPSEGGLTAGHRGITERRLDADGTSRARRSSSPGLISLASWCNSGMGMPRSRAKSMPP